MSITVEPRLAKLFIVEENEDVVPFIIRIRGIKAARTRSVYLVAVDNSWSMDGAKIFYAKQAVLQMLKHLNPEDYINVYKFNRNVTRVIFMENINNAERIAEAVTDIKLGGGTDIYRVLEHMLNDCVRIPVELKRNEKVQQLESFKMILITDGNPTVGVKDESRIVNMAERLGKHISLSLVIGVGDDYNEKLLMEVAAKTNGFFEHLSDPTNMPQIVERMVSRYKELSAGNTKLFVRTAPGIGIYVYNRPTFNIAGGVEIDVGDVYGGDVIDVIGEFIVPPQKRGKVYLASISASYVTSEGKSSMTETVSLSIPCLHSISPDLLEVDETTYKAVNAMRMASALAKDLYGDLSAEKLEKAVEELLNTTISIDRRDLYARTIDLKSQLEREGLSPEVVKKLVALISKILSGRYG
ncbi:MAG: VWA domain-containing protein [Desulfurococcaceae archaeon]